MPEKLKKRRWLIINRSIQFKYTFIVFFAVMLTAVTVGYGMFYFRDMLVKFMADDPALKLVLAHVNQVVFAAFLIVLVITACVSFIVSNKIAGPIFRFEKSIERVSQGDLTHRMKLREKDELVELSGRFNELINRYHDWILEDRTRSNEVTELLESLKRRVNLDDVPDTLRKKITPLIEEIQEKARTITSQFTL